MRITLAAVGRLRSGPQHDLIEDYVKRFNGTARQQGFEKLHLTEVEEKRPIIGNERKSREADLLNKALPQGAQIILLDEAGKEMSSQEFSQMLAQLRDTGHKDVAFVIGGAEGFAEDFKKTANRKISLGKQT